MMSVAITSVATTSIAIKSTAVMTGAVLIPSAAGRIWMDPRTPFAAIEVGPNPVPGAVLMKGAAASGFATVCPGQGQGQDAKKENSDENCGFHNRSSTKNGAQNV